MKEKFKTITHKEWIESLPKEELAFRLFGKAYSNRSCYQCVNFHRDSNGRYMCYNSEHEMDCTEEFTRWLAEDMED